MPYRATEAFYNPHGTVQGGFLTAMLDDAMGPAAFTMLSASQFAPTAEIKVSFLRPARAGTLIAEGRLVHRTKRLAYVEGKLHDEAGDLIATGSATLSIGTRRTEEEK